MSPIDIFNEFYSKSDNSNDKIEVKILNKILKLNLSDSEFQKWFIENIDSDAIFQVINNKLYLFQYTQYEDTYDGSDTKSFNTFNGNTRAMSPPSKNGKIRANSPIRFVNTNNENLESKIDNLTNIVTKLVGNINDCYNQISTLKQNEIDTENLLNNPDQYLILLTQKYPKYTFKIMSKELDKNYFRNRKIDNGTIKK